MHERLPRGIIAAASTPIMENGQPDLVRLIRHAERLRREGCAGILLAGLTGEGPAFTLADRRAMVDRLATEFPDWPLLASTGAPSIGDAAALTRHATDAGVIPLVLPPSVNPPVDEEGVIEWFPRVIDETHHADCEIVLYNLPALNGVRLTVSLVERLVARAGPSIAGLKDSTGDRSYLLELHERTPALRLYVGHEPLLVDALDLGAAGAICGMANLFAPTLVRTFQAALSGDFVTVSEDQRRISEAWSILDRFKPFSIAFKALIARRESDPEWRRMSPPLRAMDDDTLGSLAARLDPVLRSAGE
jgi:4-hydroxy-tetrahydrodipicolinate synthase